MSSIWSRSPERPLRAAILVFAFFIVATSPARAVEPAKVSGIVRDLLGQVISGVELAWVRQPARGVAPAVIAVTDANGRFELEPLLPGKYRVAALKDGYRTVIGQIDTSIAKSIELVMQPAGHAANATATDDPGWALRVPRRGMLNDLEPSFKADTPSTSSASEPLTVRFEQFFSAAAVAPEAESSSVDPRPSGTALALNSAFSEKGSLQLRGRRDQLGGGAEPRADASATQSDETVNLGFAYATSPDSQLELAASFKQTDFELSGSRTSAEELRQQQQTRAYAARWSHSLDTRSSLAVGMRYFNTGIERPGAPGKSALPVDESWRLNSVAAAEAEFQTTLGQTHDLSVEMFAESFEQPFAGSSSPSRSVRLEMEDSWRIRAPWSLIYGAGYKHSLLRGRGAMLVPRLGAGYSSGGFRVRSLLSYHAVDSGEARVRTGGVAGYRPRGRLGYVAEMVVPLATNVRLVAETSFLPVQLEHFGFGNGSALQGDHPLFLTNGNSSRREHRLRLSETRGASLTYFEVADGECAGDVIPMLPFELPVAASGDRVLRFRTGRVGVRLEPIGTDLHLEYQWVDSALQGSGEPKQEAIQETLEVRLRQEVPAESWPGIWQLLIALRMGSVRSAELENWSEYAGGESLDALNRRVSAGVSVLF